MIRISSRGILFFSQKTNPLVLTAEAFGCVLGGPAGVFRRVEVFRAVTDFELLLTSCERLSRNSTLLQCYNFGFRLAHSHDAVGFRV